MLAGIVFIILVDVKCFCLVLIFIFLCVPRKAYLGKELNKLLCFRSNPIVVLLYVLYM